MGMTHNEWVELIKKEFNVSGTVARKMYHKLLYEYEFRKSIKEVKKNDT